MHPTLSYHLAQARTADLCHRAQRDTLARAARRARPDRRWRRPPARFSQRGRVRARPMPPAQDPSLCTPVRAGEPR
jgi:hypothetical protein